METPQRRAPKSKTEYYRRWFAGEFGNRPQVWATVEELLDSGWNGRVTLRSTEVGAYLPRYQIPVSNVPVEEVPQTVKELSRLGVETCKITVNETMPDERLLIQGELCRSEDGQLAFFFSQHPGRCNEALRIDGRSLFGLSARMALEIVRQEDPSSFEDLQLLLELYPEAVIEFSTWSVKVGILCRNTVIWEVRAY